MHTNTPTQPSEKEHKKMLCKSEPNICRKQEHSYRNLFTCLFLGGFHNLPGFDAASGVVVVVVVWFGYFYRMLVIFNFSAKKEQNSMPKYIDSTRCNKKRLFMVG